MEKSPAITKRRYSEHIYFVSALAHRYIEVPLELSVQQETSSTQQYSFSHNVKALHVKLLKS